MNPIGKTAYAPVDVSWFWGRCAQKASMLMGSSKICPQIMVICRREAKAVNEIADEMGISPIYLEEILEKMKKEQLLKTPANGKYLANCCVFPRNVYTKAELYACDIFHDNRFGERITEKLLHLQDPITALDFYGNQFDYHYLMWILYVRAAYAFSDIAEEYYVRKYGSKFPKEAERQYNLTMHYVLQDETFDASVYDKLRTVGWSCLGQSFRTAKYGIVDYYNDFEATPFPNDCEDDDDWLCGRDKWVDGTSISLLLELADNPDKQLTVYEKEKAAEFLKNGLLKKENNRLVVQLPIIKADTRNQIQKLLKDELTDLAEEYAELVGKEIEKMLLPYVRKDMMGCFIHWDMPRFFEPKGALFYYGWDKCLAQPKDYSTSAAGLYLMTD